MEDEEKEDSLVCDVCCIKYNKNRIALLLNCGHTHCKICLDIIKEKAKKRQEEHPEEKNESKCPYCNNVIEWMIVNKFIMRIIEFDDLIISCGDKFLNFPLKFKYCVECKVFITNYSFKQHKIEKHYLLTFDKVLQSYIEERDIIFDKDMFKVLYFYLNPYLHDIKFLNGYCKNHSLAKKEYNFKAHMCSCNENKFLFNLMKEKNIEINSVKWYKGTLTNKKNWLIIHGYFLIKAIENNPYIQPIIFGFLNYNSIQYFGFIRINRENINKNDSLEIKDFFLDCGILYNKNYYFGKFKEINLSDLEKIGNELEQNESKIMLEGEILYLKEQGVEVKTVKLVNNKEEKPIISFELTQNKLTIIIEFKDNKSTIEIEPFYIQKNEKDIKSPFEEYKLLNCKINFVAYNRTIIFDKNEYSLYVFKNEGNDEFQISKFKAKVISINIKNDISLFVEMKNSIIKDLAKKNLEDKSNIYYLLKKMLEIKVQNCDIKCFISDVNNGGINISSRNYFEISGNNVIKKSSISDENEIEISYEDKSLNTIDTIEDFLKFELKSDIYNFKEKKKEKEVYCNTCEII